MKKFVALCALSIGLAGCDSSQLVGKLPVAIGKLPTVNVGGKPGIAAVQQAAVRVCSFLPTPGTAGQLLLAVSPSVGLAETLGAAICDTVRNMPPVPASAALAKMVPPPAAMFPTLHGVPIHGAFI